MGADWWLWWQVYANSVFGEGATFESVAKLVQEAAAEQLVDPTRLRNLIHVVFGVSKVPPPPGHVPVCAHRVCPKMLERC